jgi:hypothetical protein
MMMQGYKRLTPFSKPDAVIWWFVREYEDGFVFARGGRVRTNRLARSELMAAYGESQREYQAFLDRPVAILDGENLIPVNYGYGQ